MNYLIDFRYSMIRWNELFLYLHFCSLSRRSNDVNSQSSSACSKENTKLCEHANNFHPWRSVTRHIQL